MKKCLRYDALKFRIPYVLVVLLLGFYVAPSVTYQLPNYRSNLSEEYEPLQALKFFATKGKAFHKYGPMENYILAVPYAATLGYWRLTGQLGKFSQTYPFGFQDPLLQFGLLHLEGRILFLFLSIVFFYFFCVCLEAITSNRLIIAAAFLICVATNVPLLTMADVPRPDSPMNFFGAAALGLYILIVFEGLTPLRAVSLSVLAVFAITAKELAGTMFVLPYLGLVWTAWRNGSVSERRKFWKSVALLIGTGIVGYALLNIIYAPETWLERMNYWMHGPGIDPGVWGNNTGMQRLKGIAVSMFDNLGPGGAIAALVTIGFFFWKRPKHWILLSLPLVSLYFIGLAGMSYQEDRFFTLAAVSLVPPIVAGLAAFVQELRSTQAQAAFASAAALLISINVWYASATWLFLGQKSDSLLESGVRWLACPGADVWVFDTFQAPPASRYALLGYRADNRSAEQITKSSPDQLPQVAMASVSELQFMEDARSMPARVNLIRHELDFDLSKWHGMDALGYPRHYIMTPQFPHWFWFTWMPTVKTFVDRNKVVIYSRPCSSNASASADVLSTDSTAARLHSPIDSR